MSFVKYDGFMESVREAINNKTTVTFENQYVTNDFDKTFTVEITSIFAGYTQRHRHTAEGYYRAEEIL